MIYDPVSRRIHVLRDSVCRQIAAGEVAENPAAVLRELLDNSLDAGSSSICVTIEEGGVKKVCVRDNGAGMIKEDLEQCTLRHATSKLESAQDLLEATTMGFRGEALASIAACSKLSILSGRDGKATRLSTDARAHILLEDVAFTQGTTVCAEDLYYSLPARRNFLKNTNAETKHCFSVFKDKALAFPHVHFSFESDGKTLAVYPIQEPQDRTTLVMAEENPVDSFLSASYSDTLCKVEVHAAPYRYHRKDRKAVKIYINNRIVFDPGLQKAAVNAYSGFLPGGLFPICVVFIGIDPKYADFNVHPAKTQVRFRDSVNLFSVVHKTVKQALGTLSSDISFSAKSQAPETFQSQTDFNFPQSIESPYKTKQESYAVTQSASVVREASSYTSSPVQGNTPFIFLGSWDSLFLLVLKKGELYLIDQHAAHERVLFDMFSSHNLHAQKLLFAAELKDLEQSRLDFYSTSVKDLEATGFRYRIESDVLILTDIPDMLQGSVSGILDLFKTAELDIHKWKASAFAVMACRAAVKDGDLLDKMSAIDLIDKAFALPVPRCPHGRPVWIKITREEAFERIGRKI